MKVLFDTNFILDVLLDRSSFSEDAAFLVSKVEAGEIGGYLCATTITTIHYLATKSIGTKAAQQAIASLLSLFEVAPVTRAVLDDALKSGFGDFEDAVLYQAACHAGADGIVTRNQQDFSKITLALYSPKELAQAITKISTAS